MENDKLVELQRQRDKVEVYKSQLERMQSPYLTRDKEYNFENMGSYMVYATDFITLTPGTFAAPAFLESDPILISRGADFFIRDIRGTLCIAGATSGHLGGALINNFELDTHIALLFDQDGQEIASDYMPINHLLGDGSFPNVLPQWYGLRNTSAIIVKIRNYNLADQNYTYRLKIHFTGFERKRK